MTIYDSKRWFSIELILINVTHHDAFAYYGKNFPVPENVSNQAVNRAANTKSLREVLFHSAFHSRPAINLLLHLTRQQLSVEPTAPNGVAKKPRIH